MMKKGFLLLLLCTLFATTAFAQQPFTFKDEKVVVDTVHNIYNSDGTSKWRIERQDTTILSVYFGQEYQSNIVRTFTVRADDGTIVKSGTLYMSNYSHFVENAIVSYSYKNYVFQSDSVSNVNWMLVCPDSGDESCSVFQRTVAGGSLTYSGLRFRPGQKVRLLAQPNQTVTIASFNDFNGGIASYPVLIFDQPYYNVYYAGYWSYLPESALISN